jgi:hypothetical protein
MKLQGAGREMRLLTLALPLVALLAVFVVTDLRGVNFGDHWDEQDWQLRPVQEMVSSGLLMPRAAIYPALTKWLVLLPALGKGLLRAAQVGLEPQAIQAAMQRAVNGSGYLLVARSLFIVVSALTMIWVYLSALVLRRSLLEAAVAASALGLSWEFAYHARWVATDCITVQFTALTLLLMLAFLRWGRPWLIYGAAAATGLAIGTKFPVVPLLAPVLLCGAWKLPLYRLRAQLTRGVLLGGTAVLAYLVTTPATVFEPFKFVELLTYIAIRYEHGHYGYSVEPGWEHLSKVLLYFGLSYFSPYRALSVLLAALVPVGGYLWVRADRRTAVLLVGFPALFLIFLTTRYSALVVRNYLLLAQFFALLLARAVGELVERIRHPWGRAPVYAALLSLAVAHATFLISAGESIRNASVEDDARRALSYMASAPGTRFRLSPRIIALATEHHYPIPDNASSRRADHVAFFARSEGPDLWAWPANDPFAIEQVFGPREVNVDWYPSWVGADRVLIMSSAKAREIRVPLASRR